MASNEPGMLSKVGDGIGKGLGTVGAGIKAVESSKLLHVIRFVNFINGLALAILWPLVFIFGGQTPTPNFLAIASYCIVFALMLVAFELHLQRTEQYFRENCGFLFTFSGRTFFLFFLASLAFAATSNGWFGGYIVGIFTLLNSIFNCFVVYWHPAFQKGGPLDPNADPTDTYARGTPSLHAPTTTATATATTTGAYSSNTYNNAPSYNSAPPPSVSNAKPYVPPRASPPPATFNQGNRSDNPFAAGGGANDDNPFGTGVV